MHVRSRQRHIAHLVAGKLGKDLYGIAYAGYLEWMYAGVGGELLYRHTYHFDADAARVTPHMYIVNAQGLLVYAGGIDSVPSARVDDIPKATNYVRQAMAEIKAGKPVSVSTSRAYGCSVKYQSA